MINGFEKETHELTEEELKMIPPMIRGLDNHVGKAHAITNSRMAHGMKHNGYPVSPARVRKLIHHIRVNRLVTNLIATSSGYYIEKDPKELKIYVESLDQRIRSIQEVRDSYKLPQAEAL
jgi:hypothetical protein